MFRRTSTVLSQHESSHFAPPDSDQRLANPPRNPPSTNPPHFFESGGNHRMTSLHLLNASQSTIHQCPGVRVPPHTTVQRVSAKRVKCSGVTVLHLAAMANRSGLVLSVTFPVSLAESLSPVWNLPRVEKVIQDNFSIVQSLARLGMAAGSPDQRHPSVCYGRDVSQ